MACLLPKLALDKSKKLSYPAKFGQVKKKFFFAEFIYVKVLFRWLLLGWLLLASITTKLSWEKLNAWEFLGHHLMSPAFHPGFSDLWRSPPVLSSTPTQGFFLFESLGIQFYNLHLHVTYGTLCHARGHLHSCLGKQRISPGVGIILSICLSSHA